MIKLGIVGSEAAKFTPETEVKARITIRHLIQKTHATTVISGGCHLGGIDVWAMQEAWDMGVLTHEFKPATLKWEGGYRQRNILIAKNSDIVYCITVKELPPDYKGMRFTYCYHCGTDQHIKSGGCWTVKKARVLRKQTGIIVI
jgi:hypothetical protein